MAGPKLRTDRVLAVVTALVLILASGLYWIVQRGKLGDTRLATDKTLLMSLAALLLVVAMALGWVMVRNLARVLAGRRRGVIGSRLQVRVAFSFLFLVLIPSLTLFVGGIAIVTGTLRGIVPPDLERILAEDAALASAFYQERRARAARNARAVAEEYGARAVEADARRSRARLVRDLEAARVRLDAFAVGWIPREGAGITVSRPGSGDGEEIRPSELERLPRDAAQRVIASGRGALVEDDLAYGWVAVALEPVVAGGEVRGVAWACAYVDEPLARQLERIVSLREGAEGFERRRPALQRLYIVLFALLTTLVLFAAVWTGLYLARQITDPILELARATRAIARGNLAYRVPSAADDEIGHLARSFNTMAEEIEAQRSALERRRRYIELLLETVPVGVVSLDVAGTIRTVNREAIQALRVPTLEAGMPLSDALGAPRAVVADVVAPVLAGETSRNEAEVEIEDVGRSASLEVTAERFAMREGEEGILVVIDDLTRLRRAERLAAWGEVARRVAHEIKNPLTPIRLAAERMRRRYRADARGAESVVEEGVDTIVREVVSLKTLVDEFSRFARLPEVRPQQADVSDVAEEAVRLFRQSHDEIDIEVETQAPLPPHHVDVEAMRRVVINLLDNAVEAVSNAGRAESGRIVVRTRRDAGHRSVVLEVEDNGTGLSEEERSQLFLPTFSRRPGGTGLGLAIVHRVVSEHGGRIRAESREGGGTRVIIELPAVAVEAERGAGPVDAH